MLQFHSTLQSTFNNLFNVQLFIQCSTFYLMFNYLFNIQLFIHHSIIDSMYSTFLNPRFFWSATSFPEHRHIMMVMVADVDDFDVETGALVPT